MSTNALGAWKPVFAPANRYATAAIGYSSRYTLFPEWWVFVASEDIHPRDICTFPLYPDAEQLPKHLQWMRERGGVPLRALRGTKHEARIIERYGLDANAFWDIIVQL